MLAIVQREVVQKEAGVTGDTFYSNIHLRKAQWAPTVEDMRWNLKQKAQ